MFDLDGYIGILFLKSLSCQSQKLISIFAQRIIQVDNYILQSFGTKQGKHMLILEDADFGKIDCRHEIVLYFGQIFASENLMHVFLAIEGQMLGDFPEIAFFED